MLPTHPEAAAREYATASNFLPGRHCTWQAWLLAPAQHAHSRLPEQRAQALLHAMISFMLVMTSLLKESEGAHQLGISSQILTLSTLAFVVGMRQPAMRQACIAGVMLG